MTVSGGKIAYFFFCKQKTAYEVRISDCSSDVCSSDLSSLRFVVHAAAPCPQHIKRQMIEWWGPVIHEFYGSTEVRAVAACTAHEWLERPGTVGRSLAGAEIQIVDAEGNALPVGEVGEIICGHQTASDFTYQGRSEEHT